MCLELENRYLRELIDEIKDKNMVLRKEILLEIMKRLDNEKAEVSDRMTEASNPEKHAGMNVFSEFVEMGSEYDMADEKEDGFKTIQRKRRKAKRLGTGAVEANQEWRRRA
ncbi:hypothetical protein JTB14_002853 [Gonioctena quinquepunctata]|nr:hypothetical protein JTB14_002853 [Gonioctena quinquepunctata]